ncbi:hypothetical protein [Kitasatospora sp. NPDC088134]|uniref:hypothetical protein n=1 Tax=Kitasatospora sp. NPDC088134 TaxID=3364071 RepID=UPI0038125C8D
MTSAAVRTVPCPTCGARHREQCVTLRDKPSPVVHQARTHRYLEVHFAVIPQPATTWQALLSATEARRRGTALRGKFRDLDDWQWEDPDTLVDLIAVQPAAYENVVIMEARGLAAEAVSEVLYGSDWIDTTLDVLLRTAHDLQIRAETGQLLTGTPDRDMIHCRNAVRRRLKEARDHVDRTRKSALPAVSAPISISADPQRIASAWLGRFLKDERRALVTQYATDAGVDPVLLTNGTFYERVRRMVATGRLKAPVGPQVERLLDCPVEELREIVLRDALQPAGRTDALAHPLMLEKWAAQLDFLSSVAAPTAHSQTTGRLSELPPMASGRLSLGAADELAGRRQAHARLIERAHECERLRLALSDTVMALEQADPVRETVGAAVEAADAHLRRLHPQLYAIARAHLYPYQDSTGRLPETWNEHHASVRRTVLLALERYAQAPDVLPTSPVPVTAP